MTEGQQIVNQYQKYIDDRTKEGKDYLLSLVPTLTEAKIGFIVGFFDGSGDSGQLEEIKYLPTDYDEERALAARQNWGDIEENPAFDVVPAGIDTEKLDDALWALTPPGFENNEGGFGAVIFTVATGKIKVNYSYRVEDSVESDFEV